MNVLNCKELSERIERVRRENPNTRVDCYVLFASHTDAMQLYELARQRGFNARISTTPRQARSSCGVALLVDCQEACGVWEAAVKKPGAFF